LKERKKEARKENRKPKDGVNGVRGGEKKGEGGEGKKRFI